MINEKEADIVHSIISEVEKQIESVAKRVFLIMSDESLSVEKRNAFFNELPQYVKTKLIKEAP